MATNRNHKKPEKFNDTAKLTLTALSFISFIGSWNLIARLENNEAQANETVASQQMIAPLPLQSAPPVATPWPTIAPMIALPAIPTLVPTLTTFGQQSNIEIEPIKLEPVRLVPIPTAMSIPTLAPLPTLPAPPPPPPLQPQPQPARQRSQSGGS